MTNTVTSPEEIINNALVRMGYETRIGSIWEGSKAAKKALDIYSQTRDELLRTSDWAFAYRSIDMTLLKQAPVEGYFPPNIWNTAYPALPWNYQYGYPSDALRIKSVYTAPLFVPDFDPQPYGFTIANDDTYTPAQKVILCNVPPPATVNYIAQITNPQQMDADFLEILIAAVERALAPGLVGLEQAKLEAQDEAKANAEADQSQG